MTTDVALLEEYASTRDPDAFEELVRRYAGMVYGTCLRVTRNPHDAEDVAQECFLQLARKAGTIRSSLPGWLHRTATNRSLDSIRRSSTRRNHEKAVADETESRAHEPTWAEIAPWIDKALEELPESLRVPLVLHYLEGKSQVETAAELGFHQATVSRRIRRGVEQLRGKLKEAGVVAGAGVLVTGLAENASCATPASLTASLGKMAAAGIGGAATVSGSTAASAGANSFSNFLATILGTAKGKAIVAVSAAVIVATPFLAQRYTSDKGTRATATIPSNSDSDETVAGAEKPAAPESGIPSGSADTEEPARNQTFAEGKKTDSGKSHSKVPPGRTVEEVKSPGEKTRTEKWREDLQYLAKELPRRHPNLFFQLPEEEFRRAVADLDRSIPTLNDTEIRLSLVKLVAMAGDAYLGIAWETPSCLWYPLGFQLFTDGLFVTRTNREEYRSALGCRVVSMGNSDVDDAIEAVSRYIPRANDMSVKAGCPQWLTSADVLHMEGIVSRRDSGALLLEHRQGRRFSLEIAALPRSEIRKEASLSVFDAEDEPLPLSVEREDYYWYTYLEASKTLYVQYNRCAEMAAKPFWQFTDEVYRILNTSRPDRIVFDFRHNTGGNSEMINPLIERLVPAETNSWGRVFVIIGRNTAGSAVWNAVTLLKKTEVILVGEPSAGKPNTYREKRFLYLPNSKLRVTYFTTYVHLLAEDPPSLVPDIPVETSSEEFLARRDPVLEKILALTGDDLAAVAAAREARRWRPIECDDDRIIGAWMGTLEVDREKWHIAVLFFENEEGRVFGYLGLPDQGIMDIRINSGYFRDGKLRVAVAEMNEFLYEGTMSLDGSVIEGNVVMFARSPAPFTLQRISRTELDRIVNDATRWEPIECDDDRFEGGWEGTVIDNDGKKRLVLRFERNSDGELLGFMDSPDQGIMGVRLTGGTFRDGHLHVEIGSLDLSFEGHATEDMSVVDGRISGKGQSFPITLTRQ